MTTKQSALQYRVWGIAYGQRWSRERIRFEGDRDYTPLAFFKSASLTIMSLAAMFEFRSNSARGRIGWVQRLFRMLLPRCSDHCSLHFFKMLVSQESFLSYPIGYSHGRKAGRELEILQVHPPRRKATRFNVVAVGVEDEGSVVPIDILRSQSWLAVVFSASASAERGHSANLGLEKHYCSGNASHSRHRADADTSCSPQDPTVSMPR